MNNEYQISSLEMAITLISMIIGVGILTLPRALANVVGTTDGWISIIIGAIINMFIVFLIVKLQRNFPGVSLLNFLRQGTVGKLLAKLLGTFFVIYFVILLAYEARILTIVIRIYLLDRTPSEVTVLFILGATTYAVTKGVQGIVHLNVMFLPIVIVIISLLILFTFQEANFTHLRPVAANGWLPIMTGVQETMLAFLGIEILFFFLAYMSITDLKARYINLGIGVVAFIYLAIVIMTYVVVSFDTTKQITFPLVALAKEVEIIEGVLERFEPLLIAIWIMSIFNTMSIAHFLACKIIKDSIVRNIRVSSITIWITFVAFIITFLPKSIQETFSFGQYIAYIGYLLIVISLIVGYSFVFIKKQQKKKQGSEAI